MSIWSQGKWNLAPSGTTKWDNAKRSRIGCYRRMVQWIPRYEPVFLDSWKENEVYRRLGIGPLLGDVLDRFTYAEKTLTSQKMALYGAHDTTVAGILSTLGVFDNRWPCFTSNITFELLKGQEDRALLSFLKRDDYFVRVWYNRRVLTLPGTDTQFFVV